MLNARDLADISVYCSPSRKATNLIKPLSEVKPETRTSVFNQAYDFLSDSLIFRNEWADNSVEKFNITKKAATSFPSMECFVAMLITVRLYRSIKSMKKSYTKNSSLEEYGLKDYEDGAGIPIHNKAAMRGMEVNKVWNNVNSNDGAKNAAVKETPELAEYRQMIWKQGLDYIDEVTATSIEGRLPKSRILFLDYDFQGVYSQYKDGSRVYYDQVFERILPEIRGFDANAVKEIWTECLFPKYSKGFVNHTMKVLKNQMKAEYNHHSYATFEKYYQLLKDCGII